MAFDIRKALKNRGAKTAAIVMLFMGPIIGMLYLNTWKMALAYALAIIGLVLLDFFYEQHAIQNWEFYSQLSAQALTIFGAVHGFRLAKKTDFTAPLSWYARFSYHLTKLVLYVFVIAFFTIGPLRLVKYDLFHIPSGSMLPTLEIGDYIITDKSAYGYSKYSLPFNLPLWKGKIFSNPVKRGDIVVFDIPSQPNVVYIKRVIGVAGDTIQMIDGFVYLNGKKLEQKEIGTYTVSETGQDEEAQLLNETLPDGTTHKILNVGDNEQFDNTDIYTVPEHHYFMLGDNRDQSQDSRNLGRVGYIHEDYIFGKAGFRYYKGASDTITFENMENE